MIFAYTNTITLMSWFIFILYAFALYSNVCMYPLCTTCALLLLSIVWLKYVFPCVLLVDNYVSLNQCDLIFHFWKCDLDDLYGDVSMLIWLYWFLHLHLICIDDIYIKYYVWPLTFDWRRFWWVHLQFTSGHEFWNLSEVRFLICLVMILFWVYQWCDLMSWVHLESRVKSLSEVSFLGSRKRNLGANVSRWIAVFLCFSLIALVFPIFPF